MLIDLVLISSAIDLCMFTTSAIPVFVKGNIIVCMYSQPIRGCDCRKACKRKFRS